MHFEFYVLNYNPNAKKVENFNIFCNSPLSDRMEKEIRKYLRAPKKYKYSKYNMKTKKNEFIFGFEGFCEELKSSIRWQEWGRREYEISVADAFEENIEELEKWDCYMQAEPNIPIIAREIIRQYKEQLKEKES